MLVMDANRRMLGDTKTGEDKGDVALIAGGTLGYLVTDNGDYVSGLYYHDEKMERSPFKTGFLNLEFLLEGYHKCLTPTNKSDLNGILKYIIYNIKRRMIIVMITDTEGITKLEDSLLGQITIECLFPALYIYEQIASEEAEAEAGRDGEDRDQKAEPLRNPVGHRRYD